MATDGEIDFRTYTREQLNSVVGRIDRNTYPINYRNLVSEFQRRRVEDTKEAVSAAPTGGQTETPGIELLDVLEVKAAFQPSTGPGTWLGPARNDFHLVGSGSLTIDGEHVRLRGRRFGVVLGLPLMRNVELWRDSIVNVESDGAVIRLEYRVLDAPVRGLTMWLANVAEADRIYNALPAERTTDFSPQLYLHVEFERHLVAQSRNIPVTYGLVAISVLMYLGTAIATHDWLKVDGRLLIALGSNFGPYTADGDWWRLLTSMFLHVGLIHLAFNMWALASFGPMVERLYGSVSYSAIYLVAGLEGSLSSISWHPDINSVGASGAIFGILGAMLAAQIRGAGSIPKGVLRPLRNSSLFFTGCALLTGLESAEVDNAAHIGGVIAGFLAGLALSRPVTGQRLPISDYIRRGSRAVVLIIVVIGAGVWVALHASAQLTGEGLFARTWHWFVPGESAAIDRWHELGRAAKAGKWNDNELANALGSEIVPFWRDADARWALVVLQPTSPSYASLQFVKSVANGRLRAYQLAEKGLRQHDEKWAATAMEDMANIDVLINNKSVTDQRASD